MASRFLVTVTTNAGMVLEKCSVFERAWNTQFAVSFIDFGLIMCLTFHLDMINHLKAKFPSMYQLYTSFSTWDTLPTLFEVQIATGSHEISQDDINKHLSDLQVAATSSIQAAFDKQVAVCLVFLMVSITNLYIYIGWKGNMGPSKIRRSPRSVDRFMWSTVWPSRSTRIPRSSQLRLHPRKEAALNSRSYHNS